VHLVRDALPEAGGPASLRVVGVGNRWRSDDGAGLEAARLLRGLPGVEVVECEGEPSRVVDSFEAAEAVWVVDAVRSGAAPGTVHRFDAVAGPLPAAEFATSTHHLGLGEAVELARTLGRLPGRLVVLGVEGVSFEVGDALSPEAQAGAERAAEIVREEVRATRTRGR
jgi:hydrogenase maturation protease